MSAHTGERAKAIHTALRVLLDPDIPEEHEYNDHNCGECWQCIKGTVLLADIFRKERAAAAGAFSNGEPQP